MYPDKFLAAHYTRTLFWFTEFLLFRRSNLDIFDPGETWSHEFVDRRYK